MTANQEQPDGEEPPGPGVDGMKRPRETLRLFLETAGRRGPAVPRTRADSQPVLAVRRVSADTARYTTGYYQRPPVMGLTGR